jgi:ribosome-binding protein aMBF1 (putative translation factor)
MRARTDVQTIVDDSGAPLYAVVPFATYEKLVAHARIGRLKDKVTLPHEVVSLMVDGATAARAWREHLGLTQSEVARRMKMSQAALAQIEKAARPRKATRQKLAAALGIRVDQMGA